ncbi:MAG: NAD(P)H-dependent oxidoreductase [Spirochaetales bacterium]|nr:NAD(P)H-dependent oxidoreductase [Spirochaetales bacterium]
MNALVVFTHPNKKSLNGAFLERTLKGLKQNERINNIDVLDLYEEDFDPRLIFNEEKRRRDLYKDPSLEKHRDQILKADTIIFIYPIWWGRPPAMLMGYIDRIFASGFAYRNVKGKIMPEGMLKGKKVICISTMQGPAGYLFLLLSNAHKVLMKKALFNFVGIRKVRFFEFGSMEKKGGKQDRSLGRIEEYMSRIA